MVLISVYCIFAIKNISRKLIYSVEKVSRDFGVKLFYRLSYLRLKTEEVMGKGSKLKKKFKNGNLIEKTEENPHFSKSSMTWAHSSDYFFSFPRFLRGLEELHIPKPLREEVGGGTKEFCMEELANYSQVPALLCRLFLLNL
jgi:hypothetical protein